MQRPVALLTLACASLGAAPALAQGFQTQGTAAGTYTAPTGAYGTAAFPTPMVAPPKPLDNVGETGQFVFAIERASGLFLDRQKLTYTDAETGAKITHDYKVTSFGLLGMDSNSPSALPRFALDYVVYQGFTVGGTGMIATRGVSLDGAAGQRPEAPPTAAPDGFTLLGGVRGGFAYPFDRTFGIWPRAGLTISTSRATREVIDPRLGDTLGEFETRATFVDASFEILGVLSPLEHIVLFGGPFLDLGLGGSYSLYDGKELIDRRDAHLLSFGLLIHAGGYY